MVFHKAASYHPHFNTTGISKTDDLRRRHHHNINTQRHKYSISKHPIIHTWNTYMDSDRQPHSEPRQNNMHSLHTRPSRIQHTTLTTNRQHHSPWTSTQNTRTDSQLQTHIQPYLKTDYKPMIYSTQDNTDTQSTHINNIRETKGNDPRNIQSHNKTHTRVRFHHMVVVVNPLPWPLLMGGYRSSRLWSTSKLLRLSGQQWGVTMWCVCRCSWRWCVSCVCVLQRGNSGDGCVLTSTLCTYDLRKGDLFVLSWAGVWRVRCGSISSELIMCGGGVHSILLLPLVARCL